MELINDHEYMLLSRIAEHGSVFVSFPSCAVQDVKDEIGSAMLNLIVKDYIYSFSYAFDFEIITIRAKITPKGNKLIKFIEIISKNIKFLGKMS